MIPVSAADIVKLLETLPWWKSIAGLPKRIEALERRLDALEGRPARPLPADPKACPVCGTAMTVTRERPDAHLGPVGMKRHDMKCPACGLETDRQFDPARGYKV